MGTISFQFISLTNEMKSFLFTNFLNEMKVLKTVIVEFKTGTHPMPLPTPTLLTIRCTQVPWFFGIIGLVLLSVLPPNPVYVRRLDFSVLVFSLSSHRRPSICNLFTSHFTSYNKHKNFEGLQKSSTQQRS
jgi:hypothetical protein